MIRYFLFLLAVCFHVIGLDLSAQNKSTQDSQKPEQLQPKGEEDIWVGQLQLRNFKYETIFENMSLSWGLEFSNKDQSDYVASINYRSDFTRQFDIENKNQVVNSKEDLRVAYEYNEIFKSIGYSSEYTLVQTELNGKFQDRYDVSIAPLGIKWSVYNSKTGINRELSLKYYPNYGYLERFVTDDDGSRRLTLQRSLQHSVRLTYKAQLHEVSFNLSSIYKNLVPYDEVENARSDLYVQDLKISYNMNRSFRLGLDYNIDFDKSRPQTQGLPNTINTTVLSFDYLL